MIHRNGTYIYPGIETTEASIVATPDNDNSAWGSLFNRLGLSLSELLQIIEHLDPWHLSGLKVLKNALLTRSGLSNLGFFSKSTFTESRAILRFQEIDRGERIAA